MITKEVVRAILDRLLSDPTVPVRQYRWIEIKLLALVERAEKGKRS